MSCIPDNKGTEEMYNLYKKGYSLSIVAKEFGITRQAVFTRFKRANKELRSKKLLPFEQFNGKKYTLRYNGYYGCTDGNRTLLHRDIWISVNGYIPNGYDIHHINEDRTDNRLENLQMLNKSEHTKLHGFKNNQYTKKLCYAQ
jgi:hypothetical protein